MSKDTKDHAPAAEAGAGTNVNTGVAVVGFLLCFLAGVALMWGYDQHRRQVRRNRGRHGDRGRRVGRQRVARSHLEQGPDVGQARRAGHHRRVQRLPVPVLLSRRADARSGAHGVRTGQGPHRLEEQPPALPPEREARGRSGPGRLRARGQRRRSGSSTTRRSKTRARSATDSYAKWATEAGVKDIAAYKAGLGEPQVGRQGRQGPERRQGRGRAGDARRSSSTASSSTARSRSTTSRRRSTRSSRRRRRRSPRGRRSRASTSRCPRRTRRTRPRPRTKTRARRKTPRRCSRSPWAPARCSAARTRSSRSSSSATSSARSARESSRRSRVFATSTATRSASSGRTSRSPSTPPPSPAAEAAMEVRAEKGDKGFWDVHDRFFGDQKDLVNGQAPNVDAIVKMATRDRRERGQDQEGRSRSDAQEGDRRRPGPQRGLPGQRHAALLRQRPPPRRRSAAGEVREDHRRGDHEGAGAHRGRHEAERRLRSADEGRQGPPRAGEEGPPQVAPDQRPRARQPEREGHHPRVERLPVPVLRARRADGRAGDEGLRRAHQVRLARPSAADAPRCAARGAGRPRGLRAEGPERLLVDARQDVHQPAEDQARRPRRLREGPQP